MSQERTVPATSSRKLHDAPLDRHETWSLGDDRPRVWTHRPVSNADLPFARIVREHRTARGLSLASTAALVGRDPASIARWERGEPCVKLPTILAYANAFELPFHELVGAAMASFALYQERGAPRLHVVPPAASMLEEARALGLRAVQAYGHADRWMVWAPGQEPAETTATHCTCERFHESGACPCIALVRELESTTKEHAA